MGKTKLIVLSLLVLAVSLVFSGCTTNNNQQGTNGIKVESDVPVNSTSSPTSNNNVQNTTKSVVNSTVSTDLVNNNDVQIGQLI